MVCWEFGGAELGVGEVRFELSRFLCLRPCRSQNLVIYTSQD